MTQEELFVGIDVAKDELVLCLHPAGETRRFANSRTGLGSLGRLRLSGVWWLGSCDGHEQSFYERRHCGLSVMP